MQDIILTTENDLLIEDNDISLFTSLEDLTVQKVRINLLNYRGEWFRDISTGVPYLQSILGLRNTKDAADAVIRSAILGTDNISTISDYSSSITQERTLEVSFSAIMESGGTIENTTIEV